MSRPSVSCSGRYALTLAIRLASCARVSSSQNTAGSPVARARVTASLTQSRIGASLVWQARKMSPAQTACSITALPVGVDQADRAGGRDLEGLVVAAVLLGLLRHQADVRDRAHGGRVVGAVGAAVVDHDLVDAGVAAVREDGEGVGLLAVRAPHVAGGADHGRHGGVDDDVARDVQVGDALVGVDHGQRRALGELGVEGRLDLRRPRAGDSRPLRMPPRPSFGVRPAAASASPYCGEGLREEGAHHVAEDDRVGDLHHRGLEVHREQHALGLGARRPARSRNSRSAATRITEASTTSPASTGTDSRSTVVVPSSPTSSMRSAPSSAITTDFSVERKSSAPMVRDVRLRVGGPGAHAVRVRLGVVLDRGGGAAVGVALAQDRVHGAALDLVVAGADLALLVGLRVVRVVRQRVALAPAARRSRP